MHITRLVQCASVEHVRLAMRACAPYRQYLGVRRRVVRRGDFVVSATDDRAVLVDDDRAERTALVAVHALLRQFDRRVQVAPVVVQVGHVSVRQTRLCTSV